MQRRRVMIGLAALCAPLSAVRAQANGEKAMTGAETAAMLRGNWTVTMVEDAEIPPGNPPRLTFGPDRLAGFAGCNDFDVTLSYGEDGALTIGPADWGQQACGPVAMAMEAQVFLSLQLINAVQFETPDRIALSAFGAVRMTATRD